MNERDQTPDTEQPAPTFGVADLTIVHDLERDRPLFRLSARLVLPVGAEIELPGSSKTATVERVRLLAPVHDSDPTLSHPAYVCLDVRVPPGYDPTTA